MATAKDIHVAPIKSADARAFVERWHYSGKAYPKSSLHFGAFLDRRLVGVMSYGDPLDRSKVLPLVRDTRWHDMLELNRMAMIDATPPNTESRFIAITARLIRKHYPAIEWLLSFSDGCQCGDGTIYRAAGFLLTAIKRNVGMYQWRGEVFTTVGLNTSSAMRARFSALTGDTIQGAQDMVKHGATVLPGFQLRYILPLKPGVRDRLTVPVLPYSAIQEAGAGMYLGRKRASEASKMRPPFQVGEDGAAPIPTLHSDRALE